MAVMNLFSMMTWSNIVLNNIPLPSGMDEDTMINAILDRCAEVPLRIIQPEQLAAMNKAWFRKHLSDFSKMWNAYNMNYDPLTNYESDSKRTYNRDFQSTETGSNTSSGESTTSSDVENKVSAYDSVTYQPNTKTDGTTGGSSRVVDSRDTQHTEKSNDIDTYHESGRKMLMGADAMKKEMEVARFNVYDHIASMWEDFFCITVY